MIVGTLGKALGSYGAYVCCDTAMTRYLVNTARTLIFSTGPGPAGRRRGARGARDPGASSRAGSSALRRNARTLRDALARPGPRRSRRRDADRAARGRATPTRAMALCERALRARRVRAGDPAADRAGGHVAAAPRGDGDPQRGRAAAGPRRSSAPPFDEVGAGAAIEPRAARAVRSTMPRSNAVTPAARPVRHRARTPRSARPSWRARSPPRWRRAASACRSSSRRSRARRADGTGADHERLRAAARSSQSAGGDLPLPLRPAGVASPGGRGGRASASSPDRLRRGRAPRGRARATCWWPRASAACWSRCPASYLVRDLAADLGMPVVIAARPGLGTISHTLMTIECARAAGPRGRGRGAHALARAARRDGALEPRHDRAPRRASRSRRCRRSRCARSARSPTCRCGGGFALRRVRGASDSGR